ncbi:MAG: tRNA-splicing endonuclease subunit sen54 [Cirrosporium novae-zelandiae]|nr:MAG: tRNA-splicing endonuclease subunit sen54 [Cirrosporium novae-zelandiae]
MADADEDIIHTTPSHSNDPTYDSDDDETLPSSLLTALKSKPHPTLPRRGEKSFEPIPHLSSQANKLLRDQTDLHDTLSVPPISAPHVRCYGVFDEKRGEVWVQKAKGVHFKSMGRGAAMKGKNGKIIAGVWLWPEEALYLVERGSLEVWYPDPMMTENEEEADNEVDDDYGNETLDGLPKDALPLSLQACYALLMSRCDLTLERYQVYTGLKRSGYTVLRAKGGWGDEQNLGIEDTDERNVARKEASSEGVTEGFLLRLFQMLGLGGGRTRKQKLASPHGIARGPLVGVGLYRNYGDIYNLLTIIPHHTPSPTSTSPPTLRASSSTTTPLTITYNLYTPSPHFKKTSPGAPAFRLCVLPPPTSLTTSPTLPTLSSISNLFDQTPYDPPPGYMNNPDAKLKWGKRNVVVAVVDRGIISYLRLSDGDFSSRKVWEGGVGRGKGKGRGKGGHKGSQKGKK